MSADSSRCCFPNYSYKKHIVFYFQDKHICKSCCYGTCLHSDSSNYVDNCSFATPLPAPTSQHYFATIESNSENTILGPHTPNHNNFLPTIPSAASETAVYSSTINDQFLCLSK